MSFTTGRAIACVLLFAWATVLAPNAMAYLGTEQLRIEELPSAPSVDAVADAIWDDLPSITMSDKYSLPPHDEDPPRFYPVGGVEDHSGTFKAGWFGNSIFFFFTISDDDEDHTSVGSGMQHVDGLEFVIDLGNLEQSLAGGQAQADAYDATGGPTQFFANLNDAGMAVSGTVAMTADQAEYAYDVSTPGAFLIEVELKMSAAAIAAADATTLADIESFGLLIAYNDADTTGETTVGTEGTSGRDAIFYWWGGEQLAPGEYTSVSDDQYLAYWEGSTAYGILGQAGFVGPGEGGTGDPPVDDSCAYKLDTFAAIGQGVADYVTSLELGLPADFDDYDSEGYELVLGGFATEYGDGVLDLWQIALVVHVLCDETHPLHASVMADYLANFATAGSDPFWAIMMGISQEMHNTWGALGIVGTYEIFGVAGKTAGEPFSAAGDLDNDGLSNFEEYSEVVAAGGDVDAFVIAATSSAPFWPGNPALPVGTLFGLGVLSCAVALGGARVIRKQ